MTILNKPPLQWHYTEASHTKYVILSSGNVYGDRNGNPFISMAAAERYAIDNLSVEGYEIQPIRGKEW